MLKFPKIYDPMIPYLLELQPYEEVIGEFIALKNSLPYHRGKVFLTLKESHMFVLPANAAKAFRGIRPGTTISVFRTEKPNQPIMVERLFNQIASQNGKSRLSGGIRE